jgi:hypothetical protein
MDTGMARLELQDAIADLYRLAREQGATTSSKRLRVLGDYCLQELADRGLPGAVIEPQLPGFARTKDWDVAWCHGGKARLAISLKSLLTNLGGTVPNRLDDLIGEAANLQMAAPETVIGYLMVFNTQEDAFSKKHDCTWSDLLRRRLDSVAGRRAPHWTTGTVEAVGFVEVDFSRGATIVSGADSVSAMFDTLVAQVLARNPDVPRPRGEP